MAIKTKEEILNSVRGLISDDTTDDALNLFSDISDTMDSMTNNENTDYKKLYEENDKAWREKYRDRFMSGKPEREEDDDPDPDEKKKYSYENLFKEGK